MQTWPDRLLVLLVLFTVDYFYPIFSGPRTPWETADRWQTMYSTKAFYASFNYQHLSAATVVSPASAVCISACLYLPSVGSIVAGDMPRTITAWRWAPGETKKEKRRANHLYHWHKITLYISTQHTDRINYLCTCTESVLMCWLKANVNVLIIQLN